MDLRTFLPKRLRDHRDRRFISEIEIEFGHHIESLIERNEARGMDRAAAREEALKRFGPIDDFVGTCVRIRRCGSPLQRLFRWFFCIVFLIGVFARFAGTDAFEIQIGNMLMTIAAAGSVLLYLRSVDRAGSVPVSGDPHPLGLANCPGRDWAD